jgi:hypothetical protein
MLEHSGRAMRDPIAHVNRYLPLSLIKGLHRPAQKAPARKETPRYTVERVAGGYVVYWLGKREPGDLHDAYTRQEPPKQGFIAHLSSKQRSNRGKTGEFFTFEEGQEGFRLYAAGCS